MNKDKSADKKSIHQLIDYVRSLKIGYCASCQNLFCDHPDVRKSENGNCSEWDR